MGRKKKGKKGERTGLENINANAAGIDIGSEYHYVCVPPGRAKENVRRFGCFTRDLYALADWLAHCRVETVHGISLPGIIYVSMSA